MADLLEHLNERQREAVLETEGYVRVIAGAGSGKTKLLVSRYAYLVQEYGIDSSNILCVTFTNKAAGEMKKRIRGLIGEEHDTGFICTYHGFCHRLLRENPEKLFLSKQFQIIDSQQQKAILSDIYQKFELKLDHASFESILGKIGRRKRDMGYVPRMCNPEPCQILNEIRNQDDRIMEEFLQRQKATYSLDFHDLISFAIYMLETEEEIREKWQDRLNYIMVDEFQDSSAVELRLVETLSGKFENLMIVGDPDQNIYEWRGSDVSLLVDFDKVHESVKTIILNQNYRSTPQILQCANTLIEKNELRLKKDLFTRNEDGASVVHYHSKTELEEMDHVIENIKLLSKEEGFRYSDFAILYRSGFLSRIVEKKLVEKNIPYEIFGGVRFYQRMEILDILAYLKLIAYDDDVSFRRIVNTPRRRFGRAKMNRLEELKNTLEYGVGEMDLFGDFAQGGGERTLFATLSQYLWEKDFANSEVGPFVRLITSMREKCHGKRISEIVNEVMEKSGYETYIRELGDEERLDNLAEFKRIANEFEREFGENLNLDEFLRQIALQSGEDDKESKDAVKLMTIHSSKGLEFPVVFILGFTEGVFPSAKTIGERKKPGLEEERRLCYVAITRAEKYLFLMDSEGESQNGIKKLVSRFLGEIGEKNYIRKGKISDELAKESRGYTAKLNREMGTEAAPKKKKGDVIEHHVFGKGVIESVDEKRGSYIIRFEKLRQVRSISSDYFAKKHEDLRSKYEEKQEEREESKRHSHVEAQSRALPQVKEIDGSAGAPNKGQRMKPEQSHQPEESQEPEQNRQQEEKRGPEQSHQPEESQEPEWNRQQEEKRGLEQSRQQEEKREPERSCYQEKSQEPEQNRQQEESLKSEQSRQQEESLKSEQSRQQEESQEPEWNRQQEEKREPEQNHQQEEKREPERNCQQEEKRELKQSRQSEESPEPEQSRQQEESLKPEWNRQQAESLKPEQNRQREESLKPEQNRQRKESAEPKAVEERDKKPQEESRKARAQNLPNLWKCQEVPHIGWNCVGVEDLGAPVGICEMCGYQIIRYAHQMEHPDYGNLSVGCVCAGKMEGNVAEAKRREADFKNREARRESFLRRQWKRSKRGNEYLKIDGHLAVLCREEKDKWKYSIDNEFCQVGYDTREEVLQGVFRALEALRRKRT